jgi:hypothetical protein
VLIGESVAHLRFADADHVVIEDLSLSSFAQGVFIETEAASRIHLNRVAFDGAFQTDGATILASGELVMTNMVARGAAPGCLVSAATETGPISALHLTIINDHPDGFAALCMDGARTEGGEAGVTQALHSSIVQGGRADIFVEAPALLSTFNAFQTLESPLEDALAPGSVGDFTGERILLTDELVPAASSPALDSAVATDGEFDARGRTRRVGIAPDRGALERQPDPIFESGFE